MTIVKLFVVVFFVTLFCSLVFIFGLINYRLKRLKDPAYLTAKIQEKERVLNHLISRAKKNGLDENLIYEIEHTRTELCELYSYLEKRNISTQLAKSVF